MPKNKKPTKDTELVPMMSKKGTKILTESAKKGEIGVIPPQIRIVKTKAGKPAKKKKALNGKKPVLRRIAWFKVSKMIKDFKKREAWLEDEVQRQKSHADHSDRMQDHWHELYRKHSKNVAEAGRIIEHLEGVNQRWESNNKFLRRITENMMDYADLLKEQNKEVNVEMQPQHVSINFSKDEPLHHPNCRCDVDAKGQDE